LPPARPSESAAKADHRLLLRLRRLVAGVEVVIRQNRPRDIRARNTPRAIYRRTMYARMIRGVKEYANYLAIQYWFPYFYNDWANKHQMDWEQVTVFAKLVWHRKTNSVMELPPGSVRVHVNGRQVVVIP